MSTFKVEKVYIANKDNGLVEEKFDVLVLIGNEWVVQRSAFDTYKKAKDYIVMLNKPVEKMIFSENTVEKIQTKINKMIEDGVLFGPNMITFAEELKIENETITIYRKNQVKLVDKIKALEKELEDYKNIHISIDFADRDQNAVLIHQLSGKYMYQMFGKRFPKNSEVIISLDDLIKQRINGR